MWVSYNTVKTVLVATSCIKTAFTDFPPKNENTVKCTCIKQAPVLSQHILIIPKMLA